MKLDKWCKLQTKKERNYIAPSYRKEVFDNAPDFVKSSEVFGYGYYAAHELFISQRVYQVLAKHSLLQGLDLKPIALV